MPKTSSNRYDVVIIGAGISGLVCGCYLAKAGLNVLIAERHHKPGGYCTSFKRGPFTFDAAAHSFGGCRHAVLGKVFREFEIDRRLELTRTDPFDIVITPDYRIAFWSDLDKTVREFERAFPKERDKIRSLFSFLEAVHPDSFTQLRSLTFQEVLDRYLEDDKLKSILSFPAYGNTALPPSALSAFLAKKIFEEFMFDGGYYPRGGMQALADAFARRFEELGGELHLSCPVEKILVDDRKVTGVIVEKTESIRADYVISCCDARHTLYTLVGPDVLNRGFAARFAKLVPSLSTFVVYLGIKDGASNLPFPGANVWILSDYNLDACYAAAKRAAFDDVSGYLVHVSHDRKTVTAFMHISYESPEYWSRVKKQWLETFIARLEKEVIPELTNYIAHKEAATPNTLHRYTLNYQGATFGWEPTPDQLAVPGLRKPSRIRGLYLAGHWITQGFGISGVVQVAHDTAALFLRAEKGIQLPSESSRTSFLTS